MKQNKSIWQSLEIFMIVYETLSFTKASEILYISQPTVSFQIKKLEEELQVTLFMREGRKIEPTKEAVIFYEFATKMISQWENTVSQLTKLNQKEDCLIGCSNTISTIFVPTIIQDLLETFPDIEFHFTVMNSSETINALLKGEIDLALTEQPIFNPLLCREIVGEDDLVRAGNLDSDIWLLREDNSGMRYYTDLYLKANNIEPKHCIYCDTNAMIVRMLDQISAQTVISKQLIDNKNFEEIDIHLNRDIYLFRRKDEDSPIVKQIFQQIKELFLDNN